MAEQVGQLIVEGMLRTMDIPEEVLEDVIETLHVEQDSISQI